MKAELYWVEMTGPGRLAIMPRPRGGDWLADEMASYHEQDVTVLVSLLEHQEVVELDLATEAQAAGRAGLEYLSFPIPDRGVPNSRVAAASFVEILRNRLENAAGVAIHCRAGIGRSAMIAAAVMIARGVSCPRALECLSAARGMPVPETPEQREWLEQLAKSSPRR